METSRGLRALYCLYVAAVLTHFSSDDGLSSDVHSEELAEHLLAALHPARENGSAAQFDKFGIRCAAVGHCLPTLEASASVPSDPSIR